MKKSIVRIISAMLAVILLAAVPVSALCAFAAESEFAYETAENGIRITGCTPNGTELIVPETIDGQPVVSVDDRVFEYCGELEYLEFPTIILEDYYGMSYKFRKASSIEIDSDKTVIRWSEGSETTDISIGKDFDSVEYLSQIQGTFNPVKNISVEESNKYFEVIDGVLYDEAVETLIIYPGASEKTSYTMPSTLKTYDDRFTDYYDDDAYSLNAADSLETIVFSENFYLIDKDIVLKEIMGNMGITVASESVVDYAVCSQISAYLFNHFLPRNIKSITVAPGNKTFSDIDGVLYSADKKALYFCPANGAKDIVFPEYVGQYAVVGASGLNITISAEYSEAAYTYTKDSLCTLLKPWYIIDEAFSSFLKDKKGLSEEEITNLSDDDFLKYFNDWFALMYKEDEIFITDLDYTDFSFYTVFTLPFATSSQKSITVSDADKYVCTVDGVLYSKDKTVLVKFPIESETKFVSLPESVREFAAMDGLYMGFYSQAGSVFSKDLTVHLTVEQAEFFIDTGRILTMPGVSCLCVNETTEKIEAFNSEYAPKRLELENKAAAEIAEYTQLYENGEITEEYYNFGVLMSQLSAKAFPEIVTCDGNNSTDWVVDSETGVECLPEPHSYGFTPKLSVTKGVTDSEIETIFELHAPGRVFDIYSISLVDTDGNVIQPAEGKKVTIRIKLSEEYKVEDLFVFHISSSDPNDFESIRGNELKIENGYLVFDVTHFSWFAIGEISKNEPEPEPEVPAEKTVSSVSVSSLPAKTSYTYKLGAFDATGLALTVTYSDGSTETVADASKMTVTGFDNKNVGEKTLTVEYEGCTAEFEITVVYAWWQWIIRFLLLGFLWY